MAGEPRFELNASDAEKAARAKMASLLSDSPIPNGDMPNQVLLYARRQVVTDVLLVEWLYSKILTVPGVVMELGCRYGSRLALFSAMRGIKEPYNAHRRIIGFDTFTGFPTISEEDGAGDSLVPGFFATPLDYVNHLRDVLNAHDAESPLSHLQRSEVVPGDVRDTLPEWLAGNPESVVALAYLDLDLYEPTRACLQELRTRLVKGSVLAFDEFAHPEWPGETQAIVEEIGLEDRALIRPPGLAAPTIIVW